MATGNITRLEGVWPETHERAVRDSAGVNLETKLGNINSNISQLEQKVNGGTGDSTDATPTTASGYYYTVTGTPKVMGIATGSTSKYSGTITGTSANPSDGLDISEYVGRNLVVTCSSLSTTSNRATVIVDANFNVLDWASEKEYAASGNKYVHTFVIPENAKYFFFSCGASGVLDSVVISGEVVVGLDTRVQEIEESVQEIGEAYDKSDATITRVATGSSDPTDNPSGTRLRIYLPVKAGMKVWAITSDSGGLNCGVWDSPQNAVRASSTGLVQTVSSGYSHGFLETSITGDGYLGISLTNGSTAISDNRKQEMIDSLSFIVGSGKAYEYKNTAMGLIGNRSCVYFGEPIKLNNSFDYIRYATNSIAGQSAARYGDYLFIVADLFAKVTCYNLKTKTKLYEYSPGLTAEDTWHCNQSSFGPYFHTDSDMFPVLYVSMRNDAEGKCSALGFRIVPTLSDGEIASFTMTLTQTIKFPAMTDENCLGNVNATFDLQNGFLWGYGRNNNSEAANYNKAHFVKFAIPALYEENTLVSLVELTDADILDSFSDEWSMYNAQGGFIRNGKLVIMQGYESAGAINCRVIDLYVKQKQVSFIDLLANGFTDEPEGVFFYDGKIMTSAANANIWQIEVS